MKINPKTGRPKVILNQAQWDAIQKAFKLDDIDMQLQYILDKQVPASQKQNL